MGLWDYGAENSVSFVKEAATEATRGPEEPEELEATRETPVADCIMHTCAHILYAWAGAELHGPWIDNDADDDDADDDVAAPYCAPEALLGALPLIDRHSRHPSSGALMEVGGEEGLFNLGPV
ncbi:hypothetical protein G7046_g4103 [Stylonectria norvegica]|nr:hypothetical protein G7046_g4103 [Stylonectria norvegica]